MNSKDAGPSDASLRLVDATRSHVLQLFAEERSCAIWGGAEFRFPFRRNRSSKMYAATRSPPALCSETAMSYWDLDSTTANPQVSELPYMVAPTRLLTAHAPRPLEPGSLQ